MQTVTSTLETLIETTELYGKTSLELAKLKALETTTGVITTMISRISVIVLAACFVLIFNIGIALWLGDLLGKDYYGFFIVGGFYLLASLIAQRYLSQFIKKPFSDLIITQALQ